ncbi:MAG: hypothetical protein Fur0021_37530 [Candidatus Promineifilaceae bacterium]
MERQKNAVIKQEKSQSYFWWQTNPDVCLMDPPRQGKLCPQCGRAVLDYNDQFILVCPHCSYTAETGAFT